MSVAHIIIGLLQRINSLSNSGIFAIFFLMRASQNNRNTKNSNFYCNLPVTWFFQCIHFTFNLSLFHGFCLWINMMDTIATHIDNRNIMRHWVTTDARKEVPKGTNYTAHTNTVKPKQNTDQKIFVWTLR